MPDLTSANPNVMHGALCFAGTRVTVRTLFDHLRTGYSVDEFLRQFPTVQREQAVGVLELAGGELENRMLATSA